MLPSSPSLSLSLFLSSSVEQRSLRKRRVSMLVFAFNEKRQDFEFSFSVSNRSPRIYTYIYIRVINPVVGLRARCGFTSIYVTLAFTCRHFVPRLIDNNQVSFSHACRHVKRKIRAIVVRASVTRYVTCVHMDTPSRESFFELWELDKRR